MAVKGNNIIIQRDGMAIAGVKSQDVTSSADTIEKSSATQQSWREYVTGRKDWNLSVSYLVLNSANAADLLTVGTTYQLSECDRDGNVLVTGSAILTQCRQTSTRGNIAQGSFSFKGTGPLT